uniref:hypothetical protein n=1 Tax=Candidatus Fimenecus sp. TaxID=3022888 RepID=UPI004028A2EB
SFCAKKGIGIFPGTFFLYIVKMAERLELFVHLFAENSLPCKGRWVAVTATRRDFLKKIDFKKKVFRFLIPQSSSPLPPL